MFNSLKQKFKTFMGKAEERAEEKVKLTKGTKIKGMFRSTVKLSEGDLENILKELELDLVQNDVAFVTAEEILEEFKDRITEHEIEKENLDKFIKNSLSGILLEILTPEREINLIEQIKKSEKPFKIVFFGINGGGKTTTIAKIANYLMKNNFSVVLAAGDTFRAGAIEQLEKHANSLGIKIIKHQKGADSAAVIYDAVEHANSKGIDVVLADTAGRIQTNINLMDEMRKICRVNKPDLRLFVGDSLTGNDAVEQATEFDREVGIDAVVLTKMDADAKGGCAISIVNAIKKPILFVGTGQGYDDLVEFDKRWFVDRILGT